MTAGNIEAWLIVATTLGAVSLTAVLWIKRLPHLSADFLFLFFFTSTVMYLEVGPLAVLLADAPQTNMEIYVVPGAGAYLTEYAQVQVASLLLFQVPLLLIYHGRWRSFPQQSGTRAPALVTTRSAGIVAAAVIAAPALFMWVAYHNNLLATRWHGAYVRTQILVKMPPLDFLIYRTYQESVLFLIGITFFVFVRSEGTTRRFAALGLLANIVSYGLYGVINSRSIVILMIMCLAGWWLRAFPPRLRWGRGASIAVAAALLAGFMATTAVNVRRAGRFDRLSLSVLDPFRAGLFGDNQGYARVNCVDLVARLTREIAREGAAWGQAWEGSLWLVRRLVDPEGFDRFRLSMRTTAKSYLMRRYLRLDVVDYYSCSLVDLVGNFTWLGFPLAAVFFGAVFRFYRTAMFRPSSGTAVILGVFAVTSILYFDNEAATNLFGWVRKVPMLAAIVLAHPFSVRSQP